MRELINAARSKLDRTYHSAQYSEQRIQLQNSLVLDILHGGGAGATEVNGASSLCQWMILTAGPIGAGKSTSGIRAQQSAARSPVALGFHLHAYVRPDQREPVQDIEPFFGIAFIVVVVVVVVVVIDLSVLPQVV
jgi:hypothetical protein